MKQDEIIEIYKEVSNKLCNGTEWCWAGVGEPLQLFAKLVAAKEREACALRAEEFLTEPEPDWDGNFWNQAIERVVMAIRARGEA